jgi:hypothetical protein
MFDPVLIDPLSFLAVPHGGRHVQKLRHLILPLPEQLLRREDQDWLFALKRHEQGRERDLKGFPEPHHVGEHKAGPLRALVGLEGPLDEVFLVLPEAKPFPKDRQFDRGGRGIGVVSPVLHRPNDRSIGQAADVIDHCIGEGNGAAVIPQRFEFLSDPRGCILAVIFPEQLVVGVPGRSGRVRAA